MIKQKKGITGKGKRRRREALEDKKTQENGTRDKKRGKSKMKKRKDKEKRRIHHTREEE